MVLDNKYTEEDEELRAIMDKTEEEMREDMTDEISKHRKCYYLLMCN